MEAEDWYEAIASGIAAALVGGLAYACFLGVRDPEVGWLGHLFALLMFLGFLPGLCFAVAMFLEPFYHLAVLWNRRLFWARRPDQEEEETTAPAELRIAADDLCQQFRSDLDAANARCRGKVVEVTGRMGIWDRRGAKGVKIAGTWRHVEGEGSTYLRLPTGRDWSVECRFGPETAPDDLRGLFGKEVVVKGVCRGLQVTDYGLNVVLGDGAMLSHPVAQPDA